MLAKLCSATLDGLDAVEVVVEVDTTPGLRQFLLVGLPGTEVKEARDRVTRAVRNAGYQWPKVRITANLAPADMKKEGALLDLPIALGVLAASGSVQRERLDDYTVVGELGLDGAVRRVHGVLATSLAARKSKKMGVIVPAENVREAAIVQEIDVIGVRTLSEAVAFLNGELDIHPARVDVDELFRRAAGAGEDYEDVRGQELAKRAMTITAAGGHNVIMIGPPGAGKSMIARRLPSILPPLTIEEALETSRIYSRVGKLTSDHPLIVERPFRAPHHTASSIALIGGTSDPRPGEVSMAHNGVLFLDELPEFARSTLETLRQPLEDGFVTITRAKRVARYPTRFMLVATLNPCPCGHYGDATQECHCTPRQIQSYLSKISGPLLDRIDIHLEVAAVRPAALRGEGGGRSSSQMLTDVVTARAMQAKRFRDGVRFNSSMTGRDLKTYCPLDAESEKLLTAAMEQMSLSARAHDKIIKVSRTIADIDQSERIQGHHLAEAIQYRSLDRSYWA